MCKIIQKKFSMLEKYAMYILSLGTALRCSSTTAPRQLLLDNCSCFVLLPYIPGHMRCPTTVHPWTYALSYYRPSLDICVVLIRPPWMVEVQILQEQISARPSMDICSFEESLHCYEISGLLHGWESTICMQSFIACPAVSCRQRLKLGQWKRPESSWFPHFIKTTFFCNCRLNSVNYWWRLNGSNILFWFY